MKTVYPEGFCTEGGWVVLGVEGLSCPKIQWKKVFLHRTGFTLGLIAQQSVNRVSKKAQNYES